MDTLNTRIQLKNDIVSNWTTNNPILLKGELGIETDTRKFKVGDGINNWSTLKYASSQPAIISANIPLLTDYAYDLGTMWVKTANPTKAYILYDNTVSNAVWKQIITPDDLSALGGGDMMKATFATNAKVGQGYVDKSIVADTATEATTAVALKTARTISLTGDVSATGISFDGSQNISLTTALADTIIAGTYVKLTVNSKGLVTGFTTLSDTDIPSLTASKISDLGTSATKNTGVSVGNVVVVGADGKIDTTVLPPLAITDVFESATEVAMLALTAETGDICVRSDINKSFILKQSPTSTLANWIELKTPTDAVISVNSKTGVITLSTSDISEGTNLYYTATRDTANFNTNIALTNSSSLANGSNIMLTTNSYVFNCGSSVLS